MNTATDTKTHGSLEGSNAADLVKVVPVPAQKPYSMEDLFFGRSASTLRENLPTLEIA